MATSSRELSVVVEGMTFTECPRWRDGTLYFADFYTHRVLSVVPGREPQEVVTVPQQPSRARAGCRTAACSSCRCCDRKILRQEMSGELVEHADLGAIATGHVNDMVVAPSGVAYAGNFGFDLMAGAPFVADAARPHRPRRHGRRSPASRCSSRTARRSRPTARRSSSASRSATA